MLDKGLTVTEFADSCRECGAKYGKYIKALKQYPVLDKIRAEIEELQTYDGIYIDRAFDPDDVFEIIDKYKAESEDKE